MKIKRKANNIDKPTPVEGKLDANFYYIAGYTDEGAPYGVTWDEIITQELYFRPAMEKDANKVAELIHIAIGDIAEQLTGQSKKKDIQNTLAYFFCEINNRLSYENIIVADVAENVAGILITYPGEDMDRLNEPILKRLKKKCARGKVHLDKEADEGDYYVDTLCVDDQFRGYGIGTMLLKEAEKIAVQKGYSRISLNVAQDNPNAKNLYKHIGYEEYKVFHLNGHPYDYMVKRA